MYNILEVEDLADLEYLRDTSVTLCVTTMQDWNRVMWNAYFSEHKLMVRDNKQRFKINTT